MMYSLNRNVIPVDTHVRWLVGRLGWVTPGLNERDIHREAAKEFPEGLRVAFHINAIWHGRQVCQARTGRCADCSLSDLFATGAES